MRFSLWPGGLTHQRLAMHPAASGNNAAARYVDLAWLISASYLQSAPETRREGEPAKDFGQCSARSSDVRGLTTARRAEGADHRDLESVSVFDRRRSLEAECKTSRSMTTVSNRCVGMLAARKRDGIPHALQYCHTPPNDDGMAHC